MTEQDIQAYDAAAATLLEELQTAYPDYRWWVPTSWDALDNEKIKQAMYDDQLIVYAKRDGFIATVPTRTAAASDVEFTRRIGQIAIFTLEGTRARHNPD